MRGQWAISRLRQNGGLQVGQKLADRLSHSGTTISWNSSLNRRRQTYNPRANGWQPAFFSGKNESPVPRSLKVCRMRRRSRRGESPETRSDHWRLDRLCPAANAARDAPRLTELVEGRIEGRHRQSRRPLGWMGFTPFSSHSPHQFSSLATAGRLLAPVAGEPVRRDRATPSGCSFSDTGASAWGTSLGVYPGSGRAASWGPFRFSSVALAGHGGRRSESGDRSSCQPSSRPRQLPVPRGEAIDRSAGLTCTTIPTHRAAGAPASVLAAADIVVAPT